MDPQGLRFDNTRLDPPSLVLSTVTGSCHIRNWSNVFQRYESHCNSFITPFKYYLRSSCSCKRQYKAQFHEVANRWASPMEKINSIVAAELSFWPQQPEPQRFSFTPHFDRCWKTSMLRKKVSLEAQIYNYGEVNRVLQTESSFVMSPWFNEL